MITQREKIHNYIVEQKCCTVDELSKVFKVTPANIRHHLSILCAEGSLIVTGQKSPTRRGRPAQIYTATIQANQDNLDELTEALFTILFNMTGPYEKQAYLKTIAMQMVEKYKPDDFNPTQRVYYSIRTLNRMKYQAHWEAHVTNPRVMFSHCPYHAILGNHPEICLLDTFLLQELFGTAVKQTERLSINNKGLSECAFLLN